ncbi:MAG: DUF1553 domain-containing protein [Bacteroidota bacterium]
MKSIRYYCILILVLLSACDPPMPKEVAIAYEQLPDKIDYNFHVRPILSEHCFSCHGPDEKKRGAGLRLDIASEAFKKIEDSEQYALKAGKPTQSQVFHRIFAEEESELMPPPEAKIPLSNEQKAILIKWIEEGAVYKKHWAFVKPESKEYDFAEEHPIDYFVRKKWEEKGLSPNPKASKENLIRRLSFDLKGLPPQLEEIDRFLADSSAEGYADLIKKYLESPAYGERMAAYWMDVARYADSDGYLDDKHRDFSPWRDWVIQAFNQNVPYDSFVSLQLAGDLLPDAGVEEILPTAFNRLHKKNSEAGIELEEFRVEYVADKANTFGKAFLGLTLECARCHDHKYDPISQKDYYSLFSFFNQTDEIGHAVYGPDITPGPALLLTDKEVEDRIAFLENKIKREEEGLEKLHTSLSSKIELNLSSKDIEQTLWESQQAYYPFDELSEKGKKIISPEQKAKQKAATIYEAVLKSGKKGQALFNTDYSSAFLGEKVGWFDRTDAFSIDFWLYPDRIYEEASVFLHCEDWRLGYKGYSLHLKENKLQFLMAHAFPSNALQLTSELALEAKKWSHIHICYDGSSKANGVRFYVNGKDINMQIEVDNLYKGILYEPNIHTYGFRGFQLGKRDGILPMDKGGIDELRIFNRSLTPLEVAYLHEQTLPLEAKKEDILVWKTMRTEEGTRRKKQLKEDRDELNELVNSIPEIMVMKDLPAYRKTFVLNRGVYDEHGEEVFPTTPVSVLAFSDEYPKNRKGLSQWLFHPDNPLTARVMVNRVWEMHFGKGLVKTQEDFGNQGALPSHPELLDHLASWFQESGWDLKALHAYILSSNTYQLSSKILPRALEIDPENIYLARGERMRLSAEMIRDNALALSGLLVEKLGGPSVYPYQPLGLWDEISNKHWRYPYLQKAGDGLYRRSIYTIWKRTAPPPSMLIFDANDRSNCSVQRKESSTPLQALALLNDPQYLEAARLIAENLMLEEQGVEEYIEKAFRLLTGRRPSPNEAFLLLKLYQKEWDYFDKAPEQAEAYVSVGEYKANPKLDLKTYAALSVVIHGIMNTEEAYTRS